MAVHGCILFFPLDVPKCSQSSSYCQALSPNLLLLYRKLGWGFVHPEKIIQKRKRNRYTKKMLYNLQMTKGRQVLHLKLTRPQNEVMTLVASPTPSCSSPTQQSRPPVERTSYCSFNLLPAPALRVQRAGPPPPCGSYYCQRDLSKHSSVMPQCMPRADQTPAKVPKASRLLSSETPLPDIYERWRGGKK